MDQYEKRYPEFKFYGAVPIDFDDLPFLGIKNIKYNELYNNNKTKSSVKMEIVTEGVNKTVTDDLLNTVIEYSEKFTNKR